MVSPPWYRNAVLYTVDPATFADSNGDGWGDLAGIRDHLDHVAGLGANCLWLLPFYRTPYRDNGYDISDYLSVDPRFGDLADFASLMSAADERGIRVIVDLVVQHTSNQHPWFRSAVEDPESRYRDYYIWADEPHDDGVSPVFPGEENQVWTRDDRSGQYYRHVFYHHEPDLDHANPAVRHEIERLMEFWLRLGVAGFRVDAAPFLIQQADRGPGRDGGEFLRDLARLVRRYRTEGILLAETDVAPQEYLEYFGGEQGEGFPMAFNFYLNNHYFLALARGSREPILRALHDLPPAPSQNQYVNWIRNHDELDLGRLSEPERAEVERAFAPEPDMLLYGRGPRRRLAPMLGGDHRHIELAHSVLMSLPGAPMLRYGDEIGMGEDMSLPDRLPVRTPMQWSRRRNAGFSTAPADRLVRPVLSDGPYGYPTVNVLDQQSRHGSLLGRIGRMGRTRQGLPEVGDGPWRAIDTGTDSVLALLHGDRAADHQILMLNNLSPDEATPHLPADLLAEGAVDLLSDDDYDPVDPHRETLPLHGYGYRWLRPR